MHVWEMITRFVRHECILTEVFKIWCMSNCQKHNLVFANIACWWVKVGKHALHAHYATSQKQAASYECITHGRPCLQLKQVLQTTGSPHCLHCTHGPGERSANHIAHANYNNRRLLLCNYNKSRKAVTVHKHQLSISICLCLTMFTLAK